jgi:hypothetical protein
MIVELKYGFVSLSFEPMSFGLDILYLYVDPAIMEMEG